MSASTHKHYSWQNYRQRRLWFFAIFLGYIPGVLALGFPLTWLFGSDIPFYIVGGAWMLAFVISSIYMSSFPCPSCHRAFFFTWWHHNPLARRCVHCGFPKWSEPILEHEHKVA